MPYPNEFTPKTDFALADQEGQPVDGTKLAIALADVSQSIGQLRAFIKAGFTADGRWRPLEASSQELKDSFRFIATTGQTIYNFPGATTIDPATDKANVYVGGNLLDPDTVTVTTTGVEIPAQTSGSIIVVQLYNDSTSVRNDLASEAANKGASLIGIENKLGLFAARDAEGALVEMRLLVDQVTAAVGDLTSLIRADGSVAFTGDQPMDGNRITGAGDGIDDEDYVTVQQLNSLAAIYGDLSNIFLALTGGTLSGLLNMGNNKITNLAEGNNPNDAIRLQQLTDAVTDFTATYLPLAGGTMTGEINSKQNSQAIRIRQGVDLDEPVRVDQVGDLIDAQLLGLALGFIGGTGVLGEFPDDPECPTGSVAPDFGAGILSAGVYDYRSLTMSVNPPMGFCQYLRCTGDLRIEGRTLAALAGDPEAMGNYVRDVVFGGAVAAGAVSGAGCGGVGGRGGDSVTILGSFTAGGDGVIEQALRNRGSPAFTHEYGPWHRDVFMAGGRSVSGGVAISYGGGCIKILVDGDLYMEGALLSANGQNGVFNGGDSSYSAPGGGGTVVIVCKGTVYCGAGATIQANGGNGNSTASAAGAGGGYIAVVAGRIEGTLNLEAKGGNSNGSSYVGNGGFTEVLRATTDSGDTDPVSIVTRGAGNSNANSRDGESLIGVIQAARIPFAGGLI